MSEKNNPNTEKNIHKNERPYPGNILQRLLGKRKPKKPGMACVYAGPPADLDMFSGVYAAPAPDDPDAMEITTGPDEEPETEGTEVVLAPEPAKEAAPAPYPEMGLVYAAPVRDSEPIAMAVYAAPLFDASRVQFNPGSFVNDFGFGTPLNAPAKLTCECGAPIDPTAKFCTNCGAPVKLTCECGAPIDPSAKFCTNCGKLLPNKED